MVLVSRENGVYLIKICQKGGREEEEKGKKERENDSCENHWLHSAKKQL